MATITIEQLLPPMLASARKAFGQRWSGVKDYAEGELDKLARTVVQIQTLRLAGRISEGEASVLLEMQKNTARTVMLALKGMTLLAVEAAINAALQAVRDTVNTGLGFALL